jgi:DNA-binding CsgD family transcriptional regulator
LTLPCSPFPGEAPGSLAWRMTNKEIAAKLSVSPAAIKKRLESIYAKLDARDRRAAVAAAVSKGLIDSPVR